MMLPLARGEFAPLAPSDRSANWAVTGRLGGVSSGGVSSGDFASANLADHVGDDPRNVQRNRQLMAQLVGLQDTELAFMTAEHGGRVSFVEYPGEAGRVDSLVTDLPDIGLVAMGADCATLGIVGSTVGVAPVIAAVHCGWKGLCADVLGNTLSAMANRGVHNFQVVIGPAICGACYSVSPERSEEIRDTCDSVIADAALSVSGGIDVRRGLSAQLRKLNIPHESVGGCTFESPRELFSYRRDSRTGRQGLVMVLRESRSE